MKRPGLSLIELLIATLMCSLLSVAIVGVFKSATNAQFNLLYPNTANAAARLAMDTFTDNLRSAAAITIADASDVTYTDSSGNTDRFWISNSNLVTSTNGSPSSGTVVAYGITSLTLTYWYWNGTAWATSTTPTLSTIGAIDVTINASANGYATTLISTVRLRNNLN
jgi:Tfp pilus assembly protein PilW